MFTHSYLATNTSHGRTVGSRPHRTRHLQLVKTMVRSASYDSNVCFSFPSAPSDKDVKKAQALKEEGNALVKKGEFQKAVEKYTQSLKHNGSEVTTYTNR